MELKSREELDHTLIPFFNRIQRTSKGDLAKCRLSVERGLEMVPSLVGFSEFHGVAKQMSWNGLREDRRSALVRAVPFGCLLLLLLWSIHEDALEVSLRQAIGGSIGPPLVVCLSWEDFLQFGMVTAHNLIN